MTERSAAGYVRTLLKFQRDGMTGTLAVGAEGVNTFVRFRDGKVVFADGGTLGETLGRLLVDEQIITAEQYGQAIQTMTESLVDNEQMRLGEVLVMLGFLSHFPVTIEPLVLEGVRRFFEPERRDEILLPYLPHYTALRQDAEALIARYKLVNEEARLVRELDGTRTLGQWLDASVSDELDPGAVLTALLLADEIEAIAAPARAEPSSPPAPARPVAEDERPAAPRAVAADRRPRPEAQVAMRTPRSGEGMAPPQRDVRPVEPARPEPTEPMEPTEPTEPTVAPDRGPGALPRRQRPTGRAGATLGEATAPGRAARPLPRRGRRTGQAADPLTEEWEARDGEGQYRRSGWAEAPPDRPSWREEEPRRHRPSWREEEPRRHRPSWREEEPRRSERGRRPAEEPRRDRPSWREEEPRRSERGRRPAEEPRRDRPSWREEEPRGPEHPRRHAEEPRRQRSSWREEEPARPEQPRRRAPEPRRQRPSSREQEPRRSQARPHPHRPETVRRRRQVSQHDERRGPPRQAQDRPTGDPEAQDSQEGVDPLEMVRRMRGTHRALGEWAEDASEEEQRQEEAELLGSPSDAPPEEAAPKAESPAEKPVDERKLRLEAEQAYHRGLRLLFNQQFAQAHPELSRAADAVDDAVEYRLAAKWAEYRLCEDPDELTAQRPKLKTLARAAARQDGALPFPPYVLAHIALVEGDEVLAHKLFRIAAHRMPKNVDAERHVRRLSARMGVKTTKGTKGAKGTKGRRR
ncbi:MAG: hypothetical protein JRI68_13240 [Deltaproteobacteria bacterium]|nr:hypothetical protein [Deltaproteobacteria bacterium]